MSMGFALHVRVFRVAVAANVTVNRHHDWTPLLSYMGIAAAGTAEAIVTMRT